MIRAKLIGIAFVLTVAVCGGRAQQAGSDTTVATQAAAAYDAKNWESAAKLYRQLSQSPEAPPRVWLRLGASLRELGKYQEALAAFEKANAAGAGLFGEYGEAAVYAGMNKPDKALEHLEKAVQQGYAQPDVLNTDTTLAALRTDPRFPKILEQAKKNARPC